MTKPPTTTIASRFFRLKLLVFRLTRVTNAWSSRAISFQTFYVDSDQVWRAVFVFGGL